MDWLNIFTVLFAGFSLFTALILLLAYCFAFEQMRKTRTAKIWCAFMMVGLACLQLYHIGFFQLQVEPLAHTLYRWALLLMPITFYFFSRAVLFIDRKFSFKHTLHLLPIVIGSLMPANILPLFAFFVGSAYTLWFVNVVLRLREHSARFRFELFFFSCFAGMAVMALFLVALLPLMSSNWFFLVYTNAISLAFALVITALLVFPELLSDVAEIAESTYAKSQLGGIDTAAARQRLENEMILEERYKEESLSLSGLADSLDLSSHQLSELINTEYGYGFRRLLREHRIRAAKAILLSEPHSSILSISMETGFKSQSAFYSAFKEIEGISPGKFREHKL